MTPTPKILAFSGSARAQSLNKKLARVAAEAVRASGGEVTLVDLDDYPMPVYHGDLEEREGVPAKARELRELFRANDALLIASPENNASVSSLLKNTLDWISRPTDGQNGLVSYQGKVAALFSASPGALGGLRGLAHLRQILQRLNVLVLPEQFALPRAHEAFDATGALSDPKQQAVVTGIARRLVDVTSKLAKR
jgi:NAD(P)H-dependent FMN reductase